MRYYVYISDAKVEMLYSQIPPRLLENIAGKLTIDLKLVKTEFSESPKEKSLHSKLLIVENYLKDADLVGDPASTKGYIAGIKNMRWGSYESGLVYFGYDDDVTLGLGGSRKHVIGSVGDGNPHSHSATPFLVDAINEELGRNDQWSAVRGSHNPESMALAGVELATTQMEGVTQKFEFLARTLLRYPSELFEYTWHGKSGKPIILGTPLFVAHVD
jgi:hypothetical protein